MASNYGVIVVSILSVSLISKSSFIIYTFTLGSLVRSLSSFIVKADYTAPLLPITYTFSISEFYKVSTDYSEISVGLRSSIFFVNILAISIATLPFPITAILLTPFKSTSNLL